MKLKNIANSEDLYINDECYFIRRFHMAILNTKGKKIGEVFGHSIDTEKVVHDLKKSGGSNFFIELDCISQLLCNCADYIIRQMPMKRLKKTHNILFLNRLSLNSEYLSNENETEVLNLLFENAETIIYSYGYTELDDDFPEQDDEDYYSDYEIFLKDNEWEYYDTYAFYIKSREDMWTKDKMMDRFRKSFKSIKVKEEEFPFWLWLFTEMTECEEDFIASDDLDGTGYTNLRILQYDYAKFYLDSLLDSLHGLNDQKKSLMIDISPLMLSQFTGYIDTLKDFRDEDSCVEVSFTDPEVENNIDSILKKYHKLFYKIEKDSCFEEMYMPILIKYFKNADEFTQKKIRTIYNEIKSTRPNIGL